MLFFFLCLWRMAIPHCSGYLSSTGWRVDWGVVCALVSPFIKYGIDSKVIHSAYNLLSQEMLS